MPGGLGKAFEQKLAENFKQTCPEGLLIRLYDQQSGYRVTSANISDFLAFYKGKLYPLEAKSVQSASFPFSNLHQFDKMEAVCHIRDVKPVVVIWFTYLDRVIAVPIQTISRMKKDGFKSLNPKSVDRSKYYMLDVPSVKLRTFMNSDYRCLDDILSDTEIEEYGK